MAVKPRRVTVTTTATELTDRDTDTRSGHSILFRPAAAVFIGGVGVTTADGYPVDANAEMALDLGSGERLFAVAASGTAVVSVLRTGV